MSDNYGDLELVDTWRSQIMQILNELKPPPTDRLGVYEEQCI